MADNVHVEVEAPWLVTAVCAVFFLLYINGAWERIDCALGVQQACDWIAVYYVPKPKKTDPNKSIWKE